VFVLRSSQHRAASTSHSKADEARSVSKLDIGSHFSFDVCNLSEPHGAAGLATSHFRARRSLAALAVTASSVPVQATVDEASARD
jgi:hypothetical protein